MGGDEAFRVSALVHPPTSIGSLERKDDPARRTRALASRAADGSDQRRAFRIVLVDPQLLQAAIQRKLLTQGDFSGGSRPAPARHLRRTRPCVPPAERRPRLTGDHRLVAPIDTAWATELRASQARATLAGWTSCGREAVRARMLGADSTTKMRWRPSSPFAPGAACSDLKLRGPRPTGTMTTRGSRCASSGGSRR